MNRSIFVLMFVGAIAVAMIAYRVLDTRKERANKVLDKHIAAGGKHDEEENKIRDGLNDDGPTGERHDDDGPIEPEANKQ